jgi:GPI mannosyltransferase 1 subunit M
MPKSSVKPEMASATLDFIFRPIPLFTLSLLLRVTLLLYGLWQDAHSAFKYTDIDYLVFTDAARFIANSSPPSTSNPSPAALSGSPYLRETYRYTPLLAWLLLPTTLQSENPYLRTLYFSTGKVLFLTADLVAGYLLSSILQRQCRMTQPQALRYASIWLLNPMVATISTRGSAEGLLGVLVTALLWAVLERRVVTAGLLLGLGVHFKIYPFIYAPAIVWWMDDRRPFKGRTSSFGEAVRRFASAERVRFTLVSLATFFGLNILMFAMYVPAPFPGPLTSASLPLFLSNENGAKLTMIDTALSSWCILTSTTSPASTTGTTSLHTTPHYISPLPPHPPA